jgi:O-antigen ligase
MAIQADYRGMAGRNDPWLGRLGVAGLVAVAMIMAFLLASASGGLHVLGAVLGLAFATIVFRRPSIGILVYVTTFLFTYPAFLRGVGNLTINNLLGLMLLPMMLYGMLREGNAWILKWRPMVILAAIVAIMILAAKFYTPATDIVQQADIMKQLTSGRAQGPALIATRAASAKFLTRFVFLLFFVFFVRTPRDLKWVIATVIACLLLTYFSVSTAEGAAGWGTGRLRVQGAGVYAGRNPNKLAYFALFGLQLLWYSRRAIKSPLLYPIWFVFTAITFVMIPMTASRSGLLNLLAFMAIVMLEGRFNYRKVAGLAAVTLYFVVQFGYGMNVVGALFPEEVAGRITHFDINTEAIEAGGEAHGSAQGRVLTAQAALRVWRYHPVWGVGIGNFEAERAVTDPYGTVGPPHDSYLWALSEGGLIILLMYAGFFIWTFRRLREIEWEYEARFGPVGLGWLVNAMRTILIGFLLFSAFADMWHHALFYIIAGMCLVVIRIHQVFAETGRVPEPFRMGRPVEIATP